MMELGIFILGAIFGSLFYNVIQGATRRMKTEKEIKNELMNTKIHKGKDFASGYLEALYWVLNKKK